MADNQVVYGLTKKGFKRKRLPEIVGNMFDRFEDKTGIKVNREPDSVMGVLFNVIGYEIADMWRSAEETYNAMYPHTAEGAGLNSAAMLAGIIPFTAKPTQVYISCYGKEGTVIPRGSMVASNSNGEVTYSAVADGTITADRANHATIRIAKTQVEGMKYVLKVNASVAKYTSVAGDNENSILLKLYTAINDKTVRFNLSDVGLSIASAELDKTFAVTLSNTLQCTALSTPILFECSNDGPVTPLIKDLTSIITGVDGWEACTNEVDAVIGRHEESDGDLRLRWNASLYKRGSANIDSIQGNLLNNVQGVTSCHVFENVGNTTDEVGRPPHSIEVVISGGDDEAIARELWRVKGAGIDTHGSVAVPIIDSQGVPRVMHFNRPTVVKVWLKITLEKLSEEDWSHGNRARVVDAIVNMANVQELGQDVVLQRFMGTIYRNTQGVGLVHIEACTGDEPSGYTSDNIHIGVREVAEIVAERIEVIEHV